jgi:hypothetical protein
MGFGAHQTPSLFESMQRLKPFPLFFTIVFIILAFTFFTANIDAQSPAVLNVPIALAPLQRDTPVELVALTLDADLSESNGHTIISGNSTFKLHNTDRLTDIQAAVGFPTWAGDPYGFDPSKFSAFTVSIEGTRVRTLNPGRADLKIGTAIRTVDWYTFTVPLEGDEKKTVRVDFVQDLGDSPMPRFVYGMFPAVNWKGSIGSARLTINLPASTTLEQIIAYDPPNPEFDGQSITWRFTTKEPPANPAITFLRQSVWDDLNNKRRAAQQNPNDANARAALGNALRQIAAIDSARRDSFAMQAIAELETAVRLDPTNRAARQALGAVYESRAGPATGPRNVAYVQLAVTQWEALQNDANARKQLAEDYFYLGLEAQTRREFESASNYFDKANALAPNGAGPLFTVERMNAQRRTLNLAWARALIDQNDAPTAATKARAALGDKFMTQFTPPSFYVTKAQVTTASQMRTMLFTLAAYGSPSELLNTASGVVASLRQATDANVNLVNEGANLAISINVPFENRGHLTAKLDALTKAMPARAEWALIRAVLVPSRIEWEESDELLTHTTRYTEQVDLAGTCGTFNAQLDDVKKNLAALDNTSPNDEEAQLKRALLQYAQRGWQNALAFAQVTYRAGEDETRVNACTARTIAWSSSSWKIERIAVAVLLVELVGVGFLLWRWRGKRPSGKITQQ